jgi:hypothetical protein
LGHGLEEECEGVRICSFPLLIRHITIILVKHEEGKVGKNKEEISLDFNILICSFAEKACDILEFGKISLIGVG